MNETYINMLQNIWSQATSRIHIDKLVSDEFPINRGARQGDLLSPKLFTAVMEAVFKKVDISEGITVDGENLTNIRFANDVALFNEAPPPSLPPPTHPPPQKKKTKKPNNNNNNNKINTKTQQQQTKQNKKQKWKKHLSSLNSESLKVGL